MRERERAIEKERERQRIKDKREKERESGDNEEANTWLVFPLSVHSFFFSAGAGQSI